MTEYSHAIKINHNLEPGVLWPYKHTEKELTQLELADPYNYAAQYEQDPHKKSGKIF